MDSEKIKNFILETVAIQNNRTIKEQLLYFRNGCVLCLILFLSILYWVTFNSDYTNTSMRIIFILTILLAIIIYRRACKKHQYEANSWNTMDSSIDAPYKNNSFGRTAGSIGAATAILLIRNVNISEAMEMIYVTIAMILGILIVTHFMCNYQYKLHLLKKYCPEIKDLKPTDLE